MSASTDRSQSLVWRGALSGFCSSLVGLGLARFAYTPLIPALISEHWYSHSEAAYLGAANLAGYLVGALFGRLKARWIHTAWILRLMMLLTAVSMFACALRDFGFAWAASWRFVSGYTGGAIMVLAAPAVLAATPVERRGFISGAIFAGVGLGVVISGTLMPFLLSAGGAYAAWIGLGALSLLATVIAWNGWPPQASSAMVNGNGLAQGFQAPRLTVPVIGLFAEYGFNAIGLVPHFIFFVVYITHGLGRELGFGALCWIGFGAGATIGPIATGYVADRIGFGKALRLAFLIQTAAVGLPAIATGTIALMISGFVVGALTLGTVGLALGRIHELIDDPAAQNRAWSYATTAFAIGQAVAAYGYTYLFDRTGSYTLLFGIGAASLGLALAVDFAASAKKR